LACATPPPTTGGADVQAPAEKEVFEDAPEGTEEQTPATKETSRFAYQTLVTEPETAAAPARGKDGHLTISGITKIKPSGARPLRRLLGPACTALLAARGVHCARGHDTAAHGSGAADGDFFSGAGGGSNGKGANGAAAQRPSRQPSGSVKVRTPPPPAPA